LYNHSFIGRFAVIIVLRVLFGFNDVAFQRAGLTDADAVVSHARPGKSEYAAKDDGGLFHFSVSFTPAAIAVMRRPCTQSPQRVVEDVGLRTAEFSDRVGTRSLILAFPFGCAKLGPISGYWCLAFACRPAAKSCQVYEREPEHDGGDAAAGSADSWIRLMARQVVMADR
jgi:hypothetical protein